jgi:hypothetical protein
VSPTWLANAHHQVTASIPEACPQVCQGLQDEAGPVRARLVKPSGALLNPTAAVIAVVAAAAAAAAVTDSHVVGCSGQRRHSCVAFMSGASRVGTAAAGLQGVSRSSLLLKLEGLIGYCALLMPCSAQLESLHCWRMRSPQLQPAHLAILSWVKHIHRQYRCGCSTCSCQGLVVVQAQVIPEPHQCRLAASRHTWGAGATTTNAHGQLHGNEGGGGVQMLSAAAGSSWSKTQMLAPCP